MAPQTASCSSDFPDVVGDRHREGARRLAARLGPEVLEGLPELEPVDGIGDRRRLDVGRRGGVHVREEARQGSNLPVEPRVRLRVVLGDLPQARRRPVRVGPERDPAPVGLGRVHPHVGIDQLEAVGCELEVLDDRRAQATDRVSDAGGRDARRDLRVGEDAAHAVAPLEDEDPLPRLREIRAGDEAVVPPADDHHVVAGHQATALPARWRSRAFLCVFRTSSAAMRPGAPMMPPPGCVAEPHIHRSRTGVR